MSLDVEKQSLLRQTSPEIQRGVVGDNKETVIKWKHYTLLPVLFCYFFARGVNYYATSEWIQHYVKTEVFRNASMTTAQDGCSTQNHSDPAYQLYKQVQETTASWNMYRSLSTAVCCLVVLSILPSYSDSFGRKFMFYICFTGTFACVVLSAVAIYFKLSLWVIVAASVIEGICGTEFTLSSAAAAFVSDITTSGKRRTIGISMIDGLLLTTITITGIPVGVLIQNQGYFFVEALALIVLAVGFVLVCLLPETHKPHKRAKVRNVFANFKRTFSFYTSKEFSGKRIAYLLLIVAYTFSEMTNTQRTSLEMLYQLGMPFCWTNEMVGIFSSVRHAAQGIVGMLLVLPLRMCMSDVTIAILSTVFNGASYVIEGLAKNDVTLYLGSLFASIVTVHAVCDLVNGFLFNYVYSATVGIFNGFVFLVLAGVCGLAFLLLILFFTTQKVESALPTVEQDVGE